MALSKGAIAGIAVGAVVLILAVSAVSAYNGLVSARTGVETQANQVGNQYARKLDLIPQLQQVASQYLQNESAVQTSIAALRSGACADPKTLEDQDACSSQVTETNSLIIKVVNENYPDLRSAALYQNVQTEMINTENKVAAERGLYNDKVGDYNARIHKFPTNIVAATFGFEDKPFLGTRTTGGSAASLGTNNLS